MKGADLHCETHLSGSWSPQQLLALSCGRPRLHSLVAGKYREVHKGNFSGYAEDHPLPFCTPQRHRISDLDRLGDRFFVFRFILFHNCYQRGGA